MSTTFETETAQQLNEIAGFLTDEGLDDEAVQCLTRGLFLEPDNGYLWFNLALIYRKQNRPIQSIQALQEALNLIRDDADIWDTIAVSLFELGEFEGAQLAFKNAFKHDPQCARIWNNYGTLLFNECNFAQARNAFETSLLLDPQNYDAFFNLYDTYTELGQKDQLKKCDDILDNLELFDI